MRNEEPWNKFIYDIYKECRGLDFWDDVYQRHDKEDRAYFDMLDETINGR